MTTIQFVILIVTLLAATAAFIWMALQLKAGNAGGGGQKDAKGNLINDASKAAEKDVEHIFNDTFREELRNRGRLHFEKIIGENAMFLQQDLRLTTSQLNEYMKAEITAKLKDEFAKYEESIVSAKEMAVEAIQKTKDAIEEERQTLSQQLQIDVTGEKNRQIKAFEANMADVINHYLLASIGDQIDLNDQLEYILANFEANKKAIIEDITNGA